MRGLLVVAAVMVALAGCGGDDNKGGGSSTSKSASGAPVKGKQGGTLTMLSGGDIDYADPGLTYYSFGWQVQYAINRSLYFYDIKDPTKIIPDLATALPDISPDNKTITVKIRKGVKFSPPVKREVTAADVKYAIERAFSKNVPNGYVASYFSEIEGAPKPATKGIQEISGLQTPDPNTLVIKL